MIMQERSLVGPVALFGLVLALTIALPLIHKDQVRPAVLTLIVAATVSSLSGKWLSKSIDYWKGKIVLVGGLSVAGVFVTLLTIASLNSGNMTLPLAAGLSVFCFFAGMVIMIPFLFPLAILIGAARRIGRARPRSIVDRADRIGLWVGWAGGITLANACALFACTWTNIAVAGCVLAFFGVLLELSARAARQLREISDEGLRPRSDQTPIDPRDPRLIDFGLGDDELEAWRVPKDDPYRAGPVLVRILRGKRLDATLALAEVRRHIFVGIAFSALCLVLHLYRNFG